MSCQNGRRKEDAESKLHSILHQRIPPVSDITIALEESARCPLVCHADARPEKPESHQLSG